jgi:hypothetical protein
MLLGVNGSVSHMGTIKTFFFCSIFFCSLARVSFLDFAGYYNDFLSDHTTHVLKEAEVSHS